MTRLSKNAVPLPVNGPRLRPSERVLKYLLDEFERTDIQEGGRLPTVRELSGRLRISVCTVHQVFKKLAREGRIRTEVGKGTFLVNPAAVKTRFTIGINVPIPDNGLISLSQNWNYSIYSGILQGTLNARQTIALLPLCHQSAAKQLSPAAVLERCSQTDGAILFPTEDWEIGRTIHDFFRKAGRPVVTLNPPSEIATTNFVSPDYYGPSLKIGRAWKESGRKRILLFTHRPLEVSVSGRIRRAALAAGLVGETAESLNLTVLTAPSGDESRVYEVIRDWLVRHPVDAVFCTGDFLALETFRALRDQGRRIPEDASIIGGSGVDLAQTICPGLTRTAQPLQGLGRELMSMMLSRLGNDQPPAPGRYLDTPFIGGATTLPRENEILGISRPSDGCISRVNLEERP